MVMPEPVPPPGAAPLGTPPGTARHSVPEAARALGISERAVRKRITAGTLAAEKDGHAWVVFLPAGTGAAPTAEPEPGGGPGAAPDRRQAAPEAVPDLSPLVDLIDRQGAEIARLTEAATVWQMRSRQAEERVLALEARVAEADAGEDAPLAAPGAPGAPEPAGAAQSPSRPWWRFWER